MANGTRRIDIDLDDVYKAARVFPTQEELAAFLGVSLKTVKRRLKEKPFAEAFAAGKAEGRYSLRRAQYSAAIKGNAQMLKWLGIQELGQRDRQEITGADGGPQETRIRIVYEGDTWQPNIPSGSNGHTQNSVPSSIARRSVSLSGPDDAEAKPRA